VGVGEVTAAMAGVAATSSGIATHCPKSALKPVTGVQQSVNDGHFSHGLAHCIVDAKSLIKTVIAASVFIADASQTCKVQGPACSLSILRILGSVTRMGEYIAGVVGHCTKPGNQAAARAGEVLGLLRNLGDLSTAGTHMSILCALTDAERLYLENEDDDVTETPETTNGSFLMFSLAALLPITAVLSFVAGRRMAKSSRQPSTYDTEMLGTE